MPDKTAFGLIQDTSEWLNVGRNITRPNDPIDTLIDDERTSNIVAYWQSIAEQYQIPVMASFHAFDTEALKTYRVPVDTHNIEKGLIKVKINQTERMRMLSRTGVREDEFARYILNDGIRLADQVATRSKAAKNEMLATGKVTIQENNLNLTVDYGVPAEHTAYTLDLSEDADVPGQLEQIVEEAASKGTILTGFLTARKNVTKMRQNAKIQTSVNGNIGVGALVSRTAFEAYLADEFGLDRIITQDATYGIDGGIGVDGRPVITSKRYFPDNKVTFFAANPGGKLGTGLWGDPPEVDVTQFYPVSGSEESPYIYVTQHAEWDPAVVWTKASGLFMPVLYNPNSLYIATVGG